MNNPLKLVNNLCLCRRRLSVFPILQAEKEVRLVYRAELRACLAERRAMKAAETEMRRYLHELKVLEVARANNKYVIEGIAAFEEVPASSKEKRRLELKQGGIARQQLKREQEAMREEDLLAQAVRVEEKKQQQLELLRQQMALMGVPAEDEPEPPDLVDPDMDPEQAAKLKKQKEVSPQSIPSR